ncbi:hypothetical protein DYB28_007424 [Aphanomyces astaci]|uniref:Cyclic nucleotide-binding domain-containing protein n=1 Tax=Aphanomyces astaci TaxID=112090 RepID=A0A397FTH0_APHAT|nr:hypothetical protein DYB36_004097 [Aphanomyces astaci]RHZ39565.1 hypothetical protein DYB31_001235 [Aphanomyces astaci]RLO04935.1 hypothetical protein DYB28_007424 [Aphanomyces astaci]
MKLHSKPAMVRSPTTRLATTKSSSFKEKKNISVHVESPIQVTTVTEEPRNEQLIEEPAHVSSKTVPEPPQPLRPLPKHRVNTLAKVKGVDYLQGGRQPIPPMTLHGRILTNVDPRSRERAQKRWDALRDVVSRTPELTRITQKLQESIRCEIGFYCIYEIGKNNFDFDRILKMDPCDRRDTDIAHLYSWLMSQENLSPRFLSNYVTYTYMQNLRAAAMSFGSKVASLKPGATFGEICLIEPDSRRTATVLVDGACSSANFIVLTSSSYTKMTATQKTEKKLFQLSILSAAQLHQKHVAHTLRVLEQVSDARQKWREARINQATAYPDLLIKITSKMMRLSGNLCMQCGRSTHIAGDSVCLFDAFLKAHEPKPVERQYFHHLCKDKTDEPEDSGGSPSPHNHHDHVMTVAASPALAADDMRLSAHRQLLAEQWTEAAKHGISPRRPATTVSTSR